MTVKSQRTQPLEVEKTDVGPWHIVSPFDEIHSNVVFNFLNGTVEQYYQGQTEGRAFA